MNLEAIQLRLRECIKTAPFSQKGIANALGVSPQTVSKYMKMNIFPYLYHQELPTTPWEAYHLP